MQKTYVMLKPDAYKRKMMGKVISRIEEKNFKITNMKMFNLNEDILKEHYSHLIEKPFFKDIVEFMTSGPVVGMVIEGEEVILGIRNIVGPTKWLEAPVGTIRGDFCNVTQENLIHASDSVENALIEIKRFFGE